MVLSKGRGKRSMVPAYQTVVFLRVVSYSFCFYCCGKRRAYNLKVRVIFLSFKTGLRTRGSVRSRAGQVWLRWSHTCSALHEQRSLSRLVWLLGGHIFNVCSGKQKEKYGWVSRLIFQLSFSPPAPLPICSIWGWKGGTELGQPVSIPWGLALRPFHLEKYEMIILVTEKSSGWITCSHGTYCTLTSCCMWRLHLPWLWHRVPIIT